MRDLIIFIPSIEGGGVEKNLFYITKYIQSKFKNVYLITASKLKPNLFGKNIKLIMFSILLHRRESDTQK